MSVLWKSGQSRNLNKIEHKIHSTNTIYITGAYCHYTNFFSDAHKQKKYMTYFKLMTIKVKII